MPKNLHPFHGHEYLRIDPQDRGRERRESDRSAPPFRPNHGRKNGPPPRYSTAQEIRAFATRQRAGHPPIIPQEPPGCTGRTLAPEKISRGLGIVVFPPVTAFLTRRPLARSGSAGLGQHTTFKLELVSLFERKEMAE